MNPIPLKSLPLLALAFFAVIPLRADINSDLAFTAFQNPDLNALGSGTILQARGGLLTFPRGITSQSLFFINAAPADVAHKLISWNPSAHKDLKVWLHKSLSKQPTLADFADLGNLPDNKSVNFQIDATANLDPNKPSLQVSKEEAQLIASTAAQEKNPRALFAKAWSQILLGRIDTFLAGRGDTSYDVAEGGELHPMKDVKQLLHSDPKIYGQYQGLLNQTPFKALAGGAGPKLAPADLYCDMFDVQGSAAMGTGAAYQVQNGSAIEALDVEYYTNYGVYATIELEVLWPISIDGKNGTLVWRDDLVSAPNIAYLHGTERLASGMIMLQETKEGVVAFRDEFK